MCDDINRYTPRLMAENPTRGNSENHIRHNMNENAFTSVTEPIEQSSVLLQTVSDRLAWDRIEMGVTEKVYVCRRSLLHHWK